MAADKAPADMDDDELSAWTMEIFLQHDYDQPKQVRALFDALQDQPVSVLVRLVNEDPITSALNNYFAGRQALPGPPSDLRL